MAKISNRNCFAYGSNMDPDQMGVRCPEAKFGGVASLSNHRFILNSRGVASIIEDPFHAVYGVVWLLSKADEESLDRWEGVKKGFYFKREFDIKLHDGKMLNCLVYVASNNTRGSSKNNPQYMRRIVAVAEHHGLPSEYLTELKKWLQISGQDL